jgi:hypothetical protein
MTLTYIVVSHFIALEDLFHNFHDEVGDLILVKIAAHFVQATWSSNSVIGAS